MELLTRNIILKASPLLTGRLRMFYSMLSSCETRACRAKANLSLLPKTLLFPDVLDWEMAQWHQVSLPSWNVNSARSDFPSLRFMSIMQKICRDFNSMVVGFDMAQSAQNIIDQFFDKVFVINLDKRPDKWRRMEVELERLKIKSVERFAAIQPSFETISELDYSNMKAPEGAGPYPDYVAGSVGCKRSHLEIIRRAKAEGLKRILILEDDVSFKWRALSKLQKAVAELPSDWHMLYFGGYHLQRPVKFGRRLRRLRTTYSTFAYGFNLELSDYILESAEQSGKEIDVFYAEHVQPNYNCYIVQKGIAYQRAGFSDILGTQVNYRWLRG